MFIFIKKCLIFQALFAVNGAFVAFLVTYKFDIYFFEVFTLILVFFVYFQSMTIMITHFVYRYIAVCKYGIQSKTVKISVINSRPHLLYWFEEKTYIIRIAVSCFVVGLLFSILLYYIATPDEKVRIQFLK